METYVTRIGDVTIERVVPRERQEAQRGGDNVPVSVTGQPPPPPDTSSDEEIRVGDDEEEAEEEKTEDEAEVRDLDVPPPSVGQVPLSGAPEEDSGAEKREGDVADLGGEEEPPGPVHMTDVFSANQSANMATHDDEDSEMKEHKEVDDLGEEDEEEELEEELEAATAEPVSVMESEDLLRNIKSEPLDPEEPQDLLEEDILQQEEEEEEEEDMMEEEEEDLDGHQGDDEAEEDAKHPEQETTIKEEPKDPEDEVAEEEGVEESFKRKAGGESEEEEEKANKKKKGEEGDGESDKSLSGMKATNLRKNIREVMDETQLDEATISAQRQEMERLKRVQDQQKYIREVQRQIAINRQNNKTQTRVISLLQGNAALKSSAPGSSKPSTVLVKLSSNGGPPQVINKKVLEVLKSGKSTTTITDSKPGIVRIPNKPHMVTPSVSIAPVKPSAPAEPAKTKDVVTISSSSDEDDCIVISEPSDEEMEEEEDPNNSGMHTNDLYNIPDEQGRVLINVGKPENDPDVFLAPQIARVIKPHQIGGVRFMFDNVVESLERFDTSPGFGCILAHSMGLGKTLQVVSFCDVFLRETKAKTVMCIMPINTLQNWMAEFNMWLSTDPASSPLSLTGEVRPRNFGLFVLNDLHKTILARSRVVQEWKKDGGVLLIGYEMYRQLSLKRPARTRKGKKKIPDEDLDDEKNKPLLDEMHEALVKPGPDLVICDEGHRIKNSHASISHALKQIRTRRRIVLTGYPLQNNLQEYWCMVDFVRPNYLGSKTEFSNMFERPIQNGQCIDSTPKDIRLMRYRAHVLHSLLEGFVQRRSHAVLRNTLPQKEEYVLLVRMTSFQRTLYDTFMNEVVRTKAVPNPLKAFAVCCKIWNHPDILYNFLKKREMDELQDLDLEEAAALAPGANPGIDPNTARKTKDRKGKGNTKKAQAVATPIKNPAVATVQPNTSQSIDPKQEPGVSTDTQGQFGPNFNQSYPYQQYNNTYGQNYSNQGGSEFGNNYNQNYSGNFYNQYPGYYPGEGSSYNWSQQYNYSNYYSGFGGEPSGGFFNQEGGGSGNDFKPPKTETGEFSGGFNQKFQQPNWPNQQHGNYGTTNPGSFPPKQQQGKVAGDGQTEQKYTPNKSPKESFNEPNYPLESPQNKMVGYQQDSKHGSYSGQDFQQQTKPSQEQGGAFQTSFPPQAGGYHPGQERPNSSVHFKEASSMKQPEPGKDSQKSPGKFSEQQFGHDLNKNDNFGQGFNYNNYQQQTGCSVSGQFGKLNPQEGAPGGERSEGRVGGGSGYFNQDQTPNKFGNQNFSGDKQQQGNQFSTSSGGTGNQFSQNELQFGSNQFGSPPRGQFTDLSSGQNKRAEPEKASSFPAFSSQKEQFGGQQFGGSNQYGKPTDQVSKVGSFGIQNICNDYKEDQGSSQYDHQGVQQKGQFGSTQFGKENASTSISQTDFGLNDFGNESRMSQYDASRSYPYGGQFGKKNTQAQFGNQMSEKNCFGSTPNSSFQGQQQSFQPTNQFGTQPNTSSQSSTQTTTTTHYQDRSQFSVQNQKTQNEFGNQNQYSTQTGNKYGNQSVPSGQTNQFQNQGGGQFEGQTTNQQKVGSNQKASNQYAGGQYGGAPPPNQNLPQNASLNFNQFGNQTQFTPTSQSHGLPSSHSSANQFTGGNQQGNQFQNPSSQGGQYATNQFPSSNLHSGQYSGANFPPNQQANQFSNSNQQGSQAAQQNDQFTSTNPLNQGGSNQFSGPNLLGTQQGGNQFPGPNLSVSNKQASNQFSSPNLASNQQGGNQYSNNSQQGGNQHSSSNLPVNQQTTNQFSSSNLQSNQQGGNQFSNPSQQAGNQFSGSNRPSNQQGGNHFPSNNLSMNQQGSNQFSGSNLPGNQQGGNSFSGSNMPGNQFSSPNLPVSQQGGSQLSNANLAGNHQGSNQFSNPGQQGSNQFSNTLLPTNQSGGNQFSNPSVPPNQQGGNQFPRNENQGSNQFTRSDNQGGNQFARTDTQGGNQFVRADTQGGSQFVRADNQGGNQFTGPNHQSGNLFSNPNQQANTQFSNTSQQGGHPNHSSSQLGQFSPPNQQGSNQFQNTNQQSSSQFSPASQQTSQYSQGSQFGNSGLTSNSQFASGNSNQHGNQFSNVVGQQSGRFSSGPAPSNQQSGQFPGGPSINQQGVQFPGSSASTNQQSVQFSGGPAPNQQGVQFLGGSASSNQQTGQFSAAGGQQSGQYPGSSAPSNQQSGQFSGGSSSSNQQNSQFSSSSASMNQQNAQFTGGSTSSSQQTGQFSNATALQSTQFPHSSNQLGGQFCNTVGQQRGQFPGSSPSVNQQSSQYSGTSTPSGQQSGQFSNTIDQPSGQFPGGSATTNQQSIQFPNNSGSLNQPSGQFSNIGGQQSGQFSNGSTSMNQQSNQFSGSSTSTNQLSMQFPGSSASANQQSGQFSNIGGQQASQFPTSSMTQQGNQFSSGSASMNQQNTQFTGSTASTNQQSGQFSNAGNQQSSGQFSNAGNQQSGQFSNAGNQQSGQFNNSSVSTNQQSGQFSTSSTSTNQQGGQFSNTGSQQSSQFSTGTPSTNQQSGQFPNTGSQQSGQFSSGSTSTNQQSGQCSNNGVSQFPNSGSQYQGKQLSNHSLGGPFSQHPSGQFQPMPIPGQQSDQFLAGNQSGNQFPSHGGNQFPGTSQQSSQFGNQFGAANNLPGGYHNSQSGQQNTPVPFQGGGYGDQSVPSVAQPQGKSAQFQGGLPGDPGQDGGNLQASNCPQNKYGMYNQFGKAPEQFGPRANEFEANKQGTSCQTDPVETSGVERVEGSGEKDDCITKDTGCEPRKDNDPMSDPKRLGDVAGTSVTTVQKIKEDPGIPYDWAIELLKGYIPGKIEASAKMAVFFCILEESIALGDRILVFSQSLFTLNLMEELLQQQLVPGKEEKWLKNINYYRLDGSTSALEREKLINEFNSNPNLHLFLVSTRAGSLGINLVGANRVIVFDASWNPCHDTQAVCRVYRYGQKKPCFVYRLVTDNCLEKKIYDRQINKQGMADRVVDECNPEAHLSIKEVTSLCWDDQEDNGPKDFTDLQHKYIDVVIQKVLQKHSSLLSKEPFHHESLLVDRKDKKLSQAEKRLAKRSYELEKQANSNNARPVYNHYPNNIGTQAGVQIRGMRQDKPMASVRPMQSELGSQLVRDGRQQQRGWIPASVWQRQGMSAQEMTLPLDVVIPTNSPDRASIVLKAGQKVMVLKSPKGIYMQLENGKIIAIRTAFKVGQKDKKGMDKPEPKKDASTGPRPRHTLPNLRNSSISIIPRSSMGPRGPTNTKPVRLLGPKPIDLKGKQPMAAARPYIREPPVTVTVTKKRLPEPSTSETKVNPPPLQLQPKTRLQENSDSSDIETFDPPSSEEPRQLPQQQRFPHMMDIPETSLSSTPSVAVESLKTQGVVDPPAAGCSSDIPEIGLARSELSIQRVTPSKPKVLQDSATKSEVGTQMSVETQPQPIQPIPAMPTVEPLQVPTMSQKSHDSRKTPPPTIGEIYPLPEPSTQAGLSSNIQEHFHRPESTEQPFELYKKLDTFPPRSQQNIYEPYKKPEVKSPRGEESHRSPRKAEPFPQVDSSRSPRSSEGFRVASKTPPSVEKGYPPSTRDDSKSTLSEAIVARPEPFQPTSALPNLGHAVSIFPVGKSATQFDYGYPPRPDYYPAYPPYSSYKPDLPLQYPPAMYGAPGEGYAHQPNPFSAAAAATRAPPAPFDPDYSRYSAFHRPEVVQPATAAAGAPPPTTAPAPPPPSTYTPYAPYNPFLITPPPPQYLAPNPPPPNPPQ